MRTAASRSNQQLAFDLAPRTIPDLADRIWASGFFDGEGCVSFARVKPVGVKPEVVVTNTNLPVLEWLRERWGGGIYKHKPGTQRQPAFQWHLQESRMLAFLEDIRPYLRVKMAQTDNCLAYLRLKAQRRPHSRFTATEKLEFQAFYDAHRALDLTRGGQKGR